MKNLDRYSEPDNYIDQSGRLIKLKWFALIAAVGIILLWLMAMYPFFEMYIAAKNIK